MVKDFSDSLSSMASYLASELEGGRYSSSSYYWHSQIAFLFYQCIAVTIEQMETPGGMEDYALLTKKRKAPYCYALVTCVYWL
jgi:hypothetical protein